MAIISLFHFASSSECHAIAKEGFRPPTQEAILGERMGGLGGQQREDRVSFTPGGRIGRPWLEMKRALTPEGEQMRAIRVDAPEGIGKMAAGFANAAIFSPWGVQKIGAGVEVTILRNEVNALPRKVVPAEAALDGLADLLALWRLNAYQRRYSLAQQREYIGLEFVYGVSRVNPMGIGLDNQTFRIVAAVVRKISGPCPTLDELIKKSKK